MNLDIDSYALIRKSIITKRIKQLEKLESLNIEEIAGFFDED
jgi:hypothetical protein